MNKKNRQIINLIVQLSIISYFGLSNVDCQFNISSSLNYLNKYNELIQIKFNSINNYLHNNLIGHFNSINQLDLINHLDLNKLSGYLYKLNDYLTFYPLIDDQNEQIQLDICLANRSNICWHVDDTINSIEQPNESLNQWFKTTYNLNSLNLINLNLNSLKLNSLNLFNDSLSNFNLNNTLNSLSFKNLPSISQLTLSSFTFTSLSENLNNLPSIVNFNLNSFNLNSLNYLININRIPLINYFDKFDNEELKYILICFNLFMPFVCTAFLFLFCIQNQHRRKLTELNQLFRKIECISGLQQIKEDMKALANVIDELKLDAKQNQELKIKLQQMLSNEFKLKQQLSNQQLSNQQSICNSHSNSHQSHQHDLNGNLIKSTKNDYELSPLFTEQIGRINQQLKLNQIEQSKLKYMVCKTIESFDRILNKMKNNCELINN